MNKKQVIKQYQEDYGPEWERHFARDVDTRMDTHENFQDMLEGYVESGHCGYSVDVNADMYRYTSDNSDLVYLVTIDSDGYIMGIEDEWGVS